MKDPFADRRLHDARLAGWAVDHRPFVVAWELTRACPYACVHCRADAQPRRDPEELTAEEASALVDDLSRFGSIILVLTGGDPMARPDLEEIVGRATSRGLRVALTPSATPRVTRRRLGRLRDAGVRRVALSLDAPEPAAHDAFRGLPGSFRRTCGIAEALRKEGLSLQINTTVARHNAADLDALAEVVKELDAVQWSLFFLVPVGRARRGAMLGPHEHERLFEQIYELSRTSPFDIKVTEAPAYRRVVLSRRREQGLDGTAIKGSGYRYEDGLDRPAVSIGDGKGFFFISHTGDVCPSGFLPLVVGNVRERSVVEIYREGLLRMLRDPAFLRGKCGRCEYRELCGGSRSRAWAMTGDPFAQDPSCAYVPGAVG